MLHDYLARDLLRDLGPRSCPSLRAVRSYWLAIHENLRDVARVRAAADFLTEAVGEAQAAFIRR